MAASRLQVRPDTYVDSVLLLSATRAMTGQPGVEWAAAVMGTPGNLEVLAEHGFDRSELARIGANDLVLAVQSSSPEDAERALAAAAEVVAAKSAPSGEGGAEAARRPRRLEQAVEQLPGANLALVSVPGEFAALEAHKALSAGLHVLLFSDNVPLEAEVELKERAEEEGLLLMGPGAGTAMLGGVGLAFANAVRRGKVGVVAAAGTGAQEAMTLLDRWGAGVSHVIGVGGRDLSARVGGRMTRMGLRALEADPETSVLLLVSKPPAPEVARALLTHERAKPTVAALIGLDPATAELPGTLVKRTMDEAVMAAVQMAGASGPELRTGLAALAEAAIARLSPSRTAVRGLFSGGTLCYESMVVMSARLGRIHSNTPLTADSGLPAPPGSHVCLDLGEEEFTRGRPHPMIDPEARAGRIRDEAADASTAVILLDVVLGYGSHPDPAGVLAPVCAEATSRPDGPAVVAYVLGTDRDPQGYDRQRRLLEEAGCILAPTGARAALTAAAIAARRPSICDEEP